MATKAPGDRLGVPGGIGPDGLSVPGLVRIARHPTPDSLQPFVTTLFALRSDELQISDVLPAAVGYLVILLSGKCTVRFATGRSDAAHPVTLLTPTSAATALEVEGPWRMVAAELSTLGWTALTGLHAGRHADRAYDAAEVLGADAAALGKRLRALHRKTPDDNAALAAELAGFIEPRLRPLNPRHTVLIARVTEWLFASFNPKLAELQRTTGYSARQLQRLVERYFGTGPKQLARKYRALRVAALLLSDETGEEHAAELLNQFYDQSHLIREMRHFLGRTPLKLGKGGSPMITVATALRTFRESKPDVT